MKIAILGARRTGKTDLVRALKRDQVAETPALMAAIDRDLRWHDRSLYAAALAQQRHYDLTLVMGLDLACDPAPRSPTREAVDARLRQILADHALPYSVVYGSGPDRINNAQQAIAHRRGSATVRRTAGDTPWQWVCEKCSDAPCEHRLFTGRLQLGPR